jgi:glycosyltransferase involved in cell wall biosynthesis
MADSLLRVDLLCSGLGRVQRGFETFARECFDAFRGDKDVDMRLFKGGGDNGSRERRLFSLERSGLLAQSIARMTRRSGYHVEQLTFFLSYLRWLRSAEPQVIYLSDANLGNFLKRYRRRSGQKFRILYSNGGPIRPPFDEYDHVQQVAPTYFEEALVYGEPASKHSLVPYGIDPAGFDLPSAEQQRDARERLGLPVSRTILLSVGWISAQHKRMDYVIREVAQLPAEKRPFLMLLGHQDSASGEIQALAEERLSGGYQIRTCAQSDTYAYYRAADCFVLASLKEGFGRVYMEAMLHGLPCIVHDYPVSRYVLGSHAIYSDMNVSGGLAETLEALTLGQKDFLPMERRDHIVRSFGWAALQSAYLEMYRVTASPFRPFSND